MARRNQARRRWPGLLLNLVAIVVIAGGFFAWFYGAQARGFGQAGTSYAAKTVCSCRFVADRDMASCKTDLLPDMWAIWLNDDADAKSVSATLPLVAASEATYREGYGCVLEDWGG